MPTYVSGYPNDRPEFLEPGDYEVEVIEAVETRSKAGNPMIELKLRTPAGSHLYELLVFTPNAFWRIDAFRLSIGDKISPEETVNVAADDLVGRKGLARLVVEEYNGRKRNKVVAWLEEIEGGAF